MNTITVPSKQHAPALQSSLSGKLGSMWKLFMSLSAVSLITSTSAELATTTHYSDGLVGACGCGDTFGAFPWQYNIGNAIYTAAGSQALFDVNNAGWCGSGCGRCYRLTSTGDSACETCGYGGDAGKTITVMVTNLCPYPTNEEWCPHVGETNAHGFKYHFDIMATEANLGDNAIVEFEEVGCPFQAIQRWDECECSEASATETTYD